MGKKPTFDWKDWIGVLAGLLLVLIGVMGLIYCPNEVGRRLSDAFFIAGTVTIAVDPFLKRRLLKEASKDIFHHLLGFDLPLEVREALRQFLLENAVYSRNRIIEAKATKKNGDVEVEWMVRSDIIAVARTKFKQNVSFEQTEHGQLLETSLTSTLHPNWNYDCKNPEITPVKDERTVLEWFGKEIKMQKGEQVSILARYTTRGPESGVAVHNFGTATINPRVRVSSDDLEISASPSEQRNGDEYIYQRVFLRGDHIQVRWKPKI